MNNEPQQAKNEPPVVDSDAAEADSMDSKNEALDTAQDTVVDSADIEAGSSGSTPHARTGHTAAQDASSAAADAAEAAGDIAGAELTVDQLKEELAEAKEAALRALAEAQNARRRAEQEVDKARKFALERFAGDLLPVADNLERALEAAAAAPEANAIAEGVDLTLRSFMDVLGKNGIESVNPEGEPFDPQLHQAMSMVPNPDMEPNTVMNVMQKGYVLNGRLLRPAMVIVSKSADQG